MEASMAQPANTRKLREVSNTEDAAIPVRDEAPAAAPEAPANDVAPKAAAPAKKRSRRPLVFAGVGIIAVLAAAWWGYGYFTTGRFMVSTDDAYVEGDIATISSKLSGYV